MRNARLLPSLLLASAFSLATAPALAQRGHAPASPVVAAGSTAGALAANAPVDAEGHHFVTQAVTLTAGETVRVDLSSEQFDTILRVSGPNGFTAENDDVAPGNTDSHLEFTAPATGAYQFTVTSYRAGETGAFALRFTRTPAAAAPAVPAQPANTAAQPGAAQSGELLASSPVDAQGHHYAVQSLALDAGESVRLELGSDEFDTILRVSGPNGFTAENDDIARGDTDSRVDFVAPAAGVYQLTITSYAPNQTGEYELRVTRSGAAAMPAVPAVPAIPAQPASAYPLPAGQPSAYVWDPARGQYVPVYAQPPQPGAPAQPTIPALPAQPRGPQASNGGGRVYGVFVGVSNYPDASRNLEYTADDARNLAAALEHEGLMDPANAVVLTDENATAANVRQAFSLMSTRVGANDTFVFFYDGHGGADEIDLYSGAMRGRRLGQLLDTVPGHQLLVLDSCNSGGLASLVRGHANRDGLFSSRANEESEVASAVNAGGWLAYYLTRAVGDRAADGQDGTLQFGELASYVRRAYRSVRGQHLVVADGGDDGAVALWSRNAGGELAMQ